MKRNINLPMDTRRTKRQCPDTQKEPHIQVSRLFYEGHRTP